MAGAAEVVTFAQIGQYAQRCEAMLGSVSWEPVFLQVKQLVIADAKRNFEQGHGPDGTPWLPLKRHRDLSRFSDSHQKTITAKRRADQHNVDRLLRNFGTLMASVTAGGQGWVEVFTAKEMTVGTILNYAAVHQYGHTFNRPERTRTKPWVFPGGDGGMVFTRRIKAHTQTVPARPFLGFNERTLKTIDNIAAEFVERKIAEQGM
jgi:phage gpG-like protein